MSSASIDGYSLAPLTPAMHNQLAERYRDPATWKPFNWFGYDYFGTPSATAQTAVFGEGGALAVVTETSELVGQVQWIPGFWYGGANRNRAWYLGMLILPEYRRTRATRAAFRLVTDYLFTHTTAHRIEAAMPADALARDRGLESIGLRREGLMRKAQWREGQWHDMSLLAMLREDWDRRREEGLSDE